MRLQDHITSGFQGRLRICIIFLMVPYIHGVFQIVNSCPTCIVRWEQRATALNCDPQKLLYYHCILSTNGSLLEACLVRKTFPEGLGGCPSVSIIDGVLYHRGDNSVCPTNNSFCPANSKTYRSDQLYLYPICYRNISERDNYGGENCEENVEDKSTTPKCVIENSQGTCSCTMEAECGRNTLSWILFGISLTLNIALIIAIILLKRQKGIKGCLPCRCR